MKGDYLQEAINPRQYDSKDIDWEKEGTKNSSTRRFFQEYLIKYLKVKGKSVLDVGSGMGQLFPLLKELGASKVGGIEPSRHNVEVSRKLYPDIPVFTGALAEAPETSRYDVITAVMVFEHIENVPDAFRKINRMLTDNGYFYLTVADKKYHLTQRFGYEIESEEAGEGVVVVKTVRPQGIGTLYDILRPVDSYLDAASNNGFSLENQVELKPTESFIKDEPKYALFSNSPICHLLIFKKH